MFPKSYRRTWHFCSFICIRHKRNSRFQIVSIHAKQPCRLTKNAMLFKLILLLRCNLIVFYDTAVFLLTDSCSNGIYIVETIINITFMLIMLRFGYTSENDLPKHKFHQLQYKRHYFWIYIYRCYKLLIWDLNEASIFEIVSILMIKSLTNKYWNTLFSKCVQVSLVVQ